MVFNMAGGGGGSAKLNIKKYATAEAMLADTPKNGTVGIVADTIGNVYVQSDDPSYVDSIVAAGATYVTGKKIDETGAIVTASGWDYGDYYMEVSSAKTYIYRYRDDTTSETPSESYYFAEYDENQTFLRRVTLFENATVAKKYGHYTPTDATVKYVRPTSHYDANSSSLYTACLESTGIADDTVWIRTALYGPVTINLSKKGTLNVNPVSAYIWDYDNADWVSLDARTYQNGWKLWRKYILDAGVEIVKLKKVGNVTHEPDNGRTKFKNNIALFTTDQALDLSGYKTIKVAYEDVQRDVHNYRMLGLSSTNTGNSQPDIVSETVPYSLGEINVSSCDISNNEGTWFIRYNVRYDSTHESYVTGVWLEG